MECSVKVGAKTFLKFEAGLRTPLHLEAQQPTASKRRRAQPAGTIDLETARVPPAKVCGPVFCSRPLHVLLQPCVVPNPSRFFLGSTFATKTDTALNNSDLCANNWACPASICSRPVPLCWMCALVMGVLVVMSADINTCARLVRCAHAVVSVRKNRILRSERATWPCHPLHLRCRRLCQPTRRRLRSCSCSTRTRRTPTLRPTASRAPTTSTAWPPVLASRDLDPWWPA